MLLLESGAQPDFEDEKGLTPLSRAIENGIVSIVQLLLAREVKINFKYNTVSERHPHLNTRIMADTVILDYCSE